MIGGSPRSTRSSSRAVCWIVSGCCVLSTNEGVDGHRAAMRRLTHGAQLSVRACVTGFSGVGPSNVRHDLMLRWRLGMNCFPRGLQAGRLHASNPRTHVNNVHNFVHHFLTNMGRMVYMEQVWRTA